MAANELQEEFLDLIEGELRLVLMTRTLCTVSGESAPAYRFSIIAGQQDVGFIELRISESDFFCLFAGQIGYFIDPPFRGHRYAARALKLLGRVARRHGLNTLWITCNPENKASRRTCELAGARFQEIVDLPKDCEMYVSGDRQKCRYRLLL